MAKMTEAEILAKMKVLEDRIKAPSIWGRVPCGVRFEDLQDKRYEDTVRLLKKHYLPEEYTFAIKPLMDINRLRYIYWLEAFSRTFSRVKITYNPQYSTVMTFYNAIEKPVDIYQKLGIAKEMLKAAFLLAASANIPAVAGIFTTGNMHKKAEELGLMKEMLKSAILLCAGAHVPGISGIFTTCRQQQIAEELGFQKYHEIFYDKYKVEDEIVFWDTGLGNYGAALMAYRLPNVEEPPELKKQQSSRFNVQLENIEGDDND
ncbi:hypothetical protein MSG28_012682 [Choristoneura fumiferana]|uniref:Uncharacterized protein n=1 Tax=Choristoneura fumiferana TaxID=7141 RepID=A0ACC0JHP3_CHOFU|nr:hypothetical protein MSG28_012682 [Choristoneura fumiferana]